MIQDGFQRLTLIFNDLIRDYEQYLGKNRIPALDELTQHCIETLNRNTKEKKQVDYD